jgi:hypothetical protein
MNSASQLVVGINYPWYNYAGDFGKIIGSTQGTTGSLASGDRWDAPLPKSRNSTSVPGATIETSLDAFLDICKGLGLQVVRWFILADGWTFPAPPPSIVGKKWSYKLSSGLDDGFVSDFEKMLQSFKKMQMQVLPVLVDFKIFGPVMLVSGKDIYNRRKELRVDADKNPSISWFLANYFNKTNVMASTANDVADWSTYLKGGKESILDSNNIKAFMRLFFDPLLDACKDYRDQIYAWDICNEPDEAVQEFGTSVDQLAEFLFEGVKRVVKNKMRATIGFKLHDSFAGQFFGLPKIIGAQFANERFGNNYVQQFHYWPENRDGNGDLPKQMGSGSAGRSNVILGEFGTQIAGQSSVDWLNMDVGQRLKTIDQANYGCALLWSATLEDNLSIWNVKTQDAVKAFTGKK